MKKTQMSTMGELKKGKKVIGKMTMTLETSPRLPHGKLKKPCKNYTYLELKLLLEPKDGIAIKTPEELELGFRIACANNTLFMYDENQEKLVKLADDGKLCLYIVNLKLDKNRGVYTTQRLMELHRTKGWKDVRCELVESVQCDLLLNHKKYELKIFGINVWDCGKGGIAFSHCVKST